MRCHLKLITFHKLDCMEQRIFNILSPKRNGNIINQMTKFGLLKHSKAFTLLFCHFIGSIHKFGCTFAFQCRNCNHWHSNFLFKCSCINSVATFFDLINHIKCNYHWHINFHNLSCQVQVSLKICCINNIDYTVRLFIQNKVSRNNLFWSVWRQGIYARQIHN